MPEAKEAGAIQSRYHRLRWGVEGAEAVLRLRAPYAGQSLAAALQDLHRFHGLRRDYRGSALSCPLTTRQASLDATDRSVAPLL